MDSGGQYTAFTQIWNSQTSSHGRIRQKEHNKIPKICTARDCFSGNRFPVSSLTPVSMRTPHSANLFPAFYELGVF
jgi:hypothetical protein